MRYVHLPYIYNPPLPIMVLAPPPPTLQNEPQWKLCGIFQPRCFHSYLPSLQKHLAFLQKIKQTCEEIVVEGGVIFLFRRAAGKFAHGCK